MGGAGRWLKVSDRLDSKAADAERLDISDASDPSGSLSPDGSTDRRSERTCFERYAIVGVDK